MDAWFVREDDGRIVVDIDKAYPHYLTVIGAKKTTVAALEVARLVLTRDLKETLGPPLHLKLTGADPKKWSLKNFADESGEDEALVRRNAAAFDSFYRQLPGTPAQRVGLV
jgi:hypothetical protein